MNDIFEYVDNFSTYKNVRSDLVYGDNKNVPNPALSVIMPVYKRPEFFKIALQSVLDQDYVGEYEIVVVDNDVDNPGKNDNQRIVEEIGSRRILYYKNSLNIGMLGNWNRGIELARAPYLTYCHDDDMFLPYTLSLLMDNNKHNDGSAIFGAHNTIDSAGNMLNNVSTLKRKFGILRAKEKFQYGKWDVFMSSPGFGCGCLFSRDKMIEMGGYNPQFYPSSDYALNAVYIYNYGGIFINKPTFNYRIAINESLNVYEQFVIMDKHFRKCMSNRLNMPKFILNSIIRANYRISKLSFAVHWGKKSPEILEQIKFSDKIILRLINTLLMLKRYKISL